MMALLLAQGHEGGQLRDRAKIQVSPFLFSVVWQVKVLFPPHNIDHLCPPPSCHVNSHPEIQQLHLYWASLSGKTSET